MARGTFRLGLRPTNRKILPPSYSSYPRGSDLQSRFILGRVTVEGAFKLGCSNGSSQCEGDACATRRKTQTEALR